MLLTATVATRPPAMRVAVIAPAPSISAMIQPPKISPPGLVSAGIAQVRAASSPRGSGGPAQSASGSQSGHIAQLLPVSGVQSGLVWGRFAALQQIECNRAFYLAIIVLQCTISGVDGAFGWANRGQTVQNGSSVNSSCGRSTPRKA